MKKIFSILLIFLISTFIYSYQDITETEVGEAGQAAPFLKTGVGARALSLGGAFVSISNDATAIYYNPAGLTQIETKQLSFSHSFLSLDRKHSFASFGYPKELLIVDACGVGLIYAGVDKIEGYDERNDPTGEFSETNLAFLFSFAKKLGDNLSVGGNMKLISSSLKDSSALGFGLDLGLLFNPTEKLKVGLVVQDPYSQLNWSTGYSETVAVVAKLGASYLVWEIGDNKILLSLEAEKFATRKDIKLKAGVEFTLPYNICLRPGISGDILSIGFGYKLANFNIDYSYVVDKFRVKDTHLFSVLFSF